MRLTKRTFDWTNSEVLALEVLAQICRAEGDLFGFNSIDPTSIRTGRWAIRDGWKVRRVSRTITFEKEILLRTQTVVELLLNSRVSKAKENMPVVGDGGIQLVFTTAVEL